MTTTKARLWPIGGGSYVPETITADETVVASEPPKSKARLLAEGWTLTPDIERARKRRVWGALAGLLMEYPNVVVSRADVCAELGEDVSPHVIWDAAARIRSQTQRTIIGIACGGYMRPVPVPATGSDCCEVCGKHARLGCRLLGGRPVPLGYWCGGFRG
jgi:hypothetical protein